MIGFASTIKNTEDIQTIKLKGMVGENSSTITPTTCASSEVLEDWPESDDWIDCKVAGPSDWPATSESTFSRGQNNQAASCPPGKDMDNDKKIYSKQKRLGESVTVPYDVIQTAEAIVMATNVVKCSTKSEKPNIVDDGVSASGSVSEKLPPPQDRNKRASAKGEELEGRIDAAVRRYYDGKQEAWQNRIDKAVERYLDKGLPSPSLSQSQHGKRSSTSSGTKKNAPTRRRSKGSSAIADFSSRSAGDPRSISRLLEDTPQKDAMQNRSKSLHSRNCAEDSDNLNSAIRRRRKSRSRTPTSRQEREVRADEDVSNRGFDEGKGTVLRRKVKSRSHTMTSPLTDGSNPSTAKQETKRTTGIRGSEGRSSNCEASIPVIIRKNVPKRRKSKGSSAMTDFSTRSAGDPRSISKLIEENPQQDQRRSKSLHSRKSADDNDKLNGAVDGRGPADERRRRKSRSRTPTSRREREFHTDEDVSNRGFDGEKSPILRRKVKSRRQVSEVSAPVTAIKIIKRDSRASEGRSSNCETCVPVIIKKQVPTMRKSKGSSAMTDFSTRSAGDPRSISRLLEESPQQEQRRSKSLHSRKCTDDNNKVNNVADDRGESCVDQRRRRKSRSSTPTSRLDRANRSRTPTSRRDRAGAGRSRTPTSRHDRAGRSRTPTSRRDRVVHTVEDVASQAIDCPDKTPSQRRSSRRLTQSVDEAKRPRSRGASRQKKRESVSENESSRHGRTGNSCEESTKLPEGQAKINRQRRGSRSRKSKNNEDESSSRHGRSVHNDEDGSNQTIDGPDKTSSQRRGSRRATRRSLQEELLSQNDEGNAETSRRPTRRSFQDELISQRDKGNNDRSRRATRRSLQDESASQHNRSSIDRSRRAARKSFQDESINQQEEGSANNEDGLDQEKTPSQRRGSRRLTRRSIQVESIGQLDDGSADQDGSTEVFDDQEKTASQRRGSRRLTRKSLQDGSIGQLDEVNAGQAGLDQTVNVQEKNPSQRRGSRYLTRRSFQDESIGQLDEGNADHDESSKINDSQEKSTSQRRERSQKTDITTNRHDWGTLDVDDAQRRPRLSIQRDDNSSSDEAGTWQKDSADIGNIVAMSKSSQEENSLPKRNIENLDMSDSHSEIDTKRRERKIDELGTSHHSQANLDAWRIEGVTGVPIVACASQKNSQEEQPKSSLLSLLESLSPSNRERYQQGAKSVFGIIPEWQKRGNLEGQRSSLLGANTTPLKGKQNGLNSLLNPSAQLKLQEHLNRQLLGFASGSGSVLASGTKRSDSEPALLQKGRLVKSKHNASNSSLQPNAQWKLQDHLRRQPSTFALSSGSVLTSGTNRSDSEPALLRKGLFVKNSNNGSSSSLQANAQWKLQDHLRRRPSTFASSNGSVRTSGTKRSDSEPTLLRKGLFVKTNNGLNSSPQPNAPWKLQDHLCRQPSTFASSNRSVLSNMSGSKSALTQNGFFVKTNFNRSESSLQPNAQWRLQDHFGGRSSTFASSNRSVLTSGTKRSDSEPALMQKGLFVKSNNNKSNSSLQPNAQWKLEDNLDWKSSAFSSCNGSVLTSGTKKSDSEPALFQNGFVVNPFNNKSDSIPQQNAQWKLEERLGGGKPSPFTTFSNSVFSMGAKNSDSEPVLFKKGFVVKNEKNSEALSQPNTQMSQCKLKKHLGRQPSSITKSNGSALTAGTKKLSDSLSSFSPKPSAEWSEWKQQGSQDIRLPSHVANIASCRRMMMSQSRADSAPELFRTDPLVGSTGNGKRNSDFFGIPNPPFQQRQFQENHEDRLREYF